MEPEFIYQRLDAKRRSHASKVLEEEMMARVVGQDRAVRKIATTYDVIRSGLTPASRPIASWLFLGPTGVGKTKVCEALADSLFEDPTKFLKINCGEYQHSHEVAKLIGAPPGYTGYGDMSPVLSQQALEQYRTPETNFTLVLFDEIEKGHPALWDLLLGILDKGELTLGKGDRVDFTRTIIVMTSNIGARDMNNLVTAGLGFAPKASDTMSRAEMDQKIYRTAIEAARKRFSPEFMNRIDRAIVFRSLTREHVLTIVDMELAAVTRKAGETDVPFTIMADPDARNFLLEEGYDARYGARELKRAIHRFVTEPLASLVACGDVLPNDSIVLTVEDGELALNRVVINPAYVVEERPLLDPECYEIPIGRGPREPEEDPSRLLSQ